MATEAEQSRQARRRKIVERGTDRLALITGQRRDFEPIPPSGNSSITDPPLVSFSNSPSPSLINDNLPTVLSEVQDSSSSLGGLEISEKSILESEVVLDETKPKQISIANGTRDPFSSSRGSFGEFQHQKRRQMTTKMVTSAVDETEKSRLIFTIVFAVIVVWFTWGFSFIGLNFIKRIVLFKPALLLLTSNISLVVGRLIMNDEKDGESALKQRASTSKEDDWIQQVGKALEMGIVWKKTMDALLLNFSVYAIIVVFCLSIF